MILHELSQHHTAILNTLKMYVKNEDDWDGNITWDDKAGKIHLQINKFNGTVYFVSEEFKEKIRAAEEKIVIGRNYLKTLEKQEKKEEEIEVRKEKKESRLFYRYRLPNDCYDLYITEQQSVELDCKESEDYISTKHYLRLNEPKYIDKYTTAYSSDIMRAILSHQ